MIFVHAAPTEIEEVAFFIEMQLYPLMPSLWHYWEAINASISLEPYRYIASTVVYRIKLSAFLISFGVFASNITTNTAGPCKPIAQKNIAPASLAQRGV